MEVQTWKKIVISIVFIGILFSPILLKPDTDTPVFDTEDLMVEAMEQFGFYFEEINNGEAGIDFIHQSPVLDDKLLHILPQIASMGAAVSVCDYDNDGWHDLYFTSSKKGSQNVLYHNNRDGTFTDRAESLKIDNINHAETGVTMGTVWGDYDNDGWEDLFIYKWGRPTLLKNISGKEFENVTENANLPKWVNANTSIWFDMNNDGFLDLFIGGYYHEEFDLWNLETTRIMPESYEYANNGGRNYLLLNQGDGTFKDVAQDYGLSSTKWTLAAGALDTNGDNYPELIIANDYSVDEFFLNNRGTSFTEIGKEVGLGFTPKSGMNISFADVNNESQLGIYISNITEMGVLLQGNNFWWPQNQNGKLFYKNIARPLGIELGGWSYGAQFGDINNNGHLDLYVANGFISAQIGTSYWYEYSKISGGNKEIISDAGNWPAMEGKSQSGYQQNMIWLNKGQGVFEDVSTKAVTRKTLDGRSVVMVDLWNRGVLDVVVANQNSAPMLYKNNVDSARHWIDFELTGTRSNRSAIGATVEVSWSDQNQKQVITGGIGFCSQNQDRLHFGLGRNEVVKKVRIQWPSGEQQVIINPAIDQVHKVVEMKEGKKTG